MFTGNKTALVAVLLTSFLFGAAAAEEESLWNYADASADIVLYINTRQPEEGMSKSIQERIRRDQELIRTKTGEEPFFDTKDRDLELIANLRIGKLSPFSGTVEGVANITGNLQGDIDRVMETIKGESDLTPEIIRKDEKNYYNVTIPATEKTGPIDIQLVPVTPNQIQFRVNFTPDNKMSQTLLGTTSTQSGEIARVRGQDLALACIIMPDKLSGLSASNDDGMENYVNFLKRVSGIAISARMIGDHTILTGFFNFKAADDAAEFSKSIQALLPQLPLISNDEQYKARTSVNGSGAEIVIPFKTSDTWDLITSVTVHNPAVDGIGSGKKDDEAGQTPAGE